MGRLAFMLAALVLLAGCRSAAPVATPAEILAGAEVVLTGDCPEEWGGGDLVCTAWDAPGGVRYVSVHGPDGEPVVILIRGEDGVFEIAWEADDG